MRRSGVTIENFYEAGRRWQFGDRSYIWSYTTDARFDANQATRLELVRKIRYFEQNNPLVQALADVFEQYVVGANGLIISPGSSDQVWNTLAKEYFNEWSVFPDLTSLQDWPCLQGLIARTWFIDGEVFILKTRGETPPYRPRIQLIEGHRVATPPGLVGEEGKTIIDGCTIDKRGRTTGYWIASGVDMSEFTWRPASEVIHVFEPNRISMYRGITHFYAVLNLMHDLDDLLRWEMAKAKEAAETSGIIKTPTGELLNDQEEFDNQTETDTTGIGESNPLTEYYQRIFGPTKKVMKIGDEYEIPQNNNPTANQQWYYRYIGEQICVGVGTPIEVIYPSAELGGAPYRGMLSKSSSQFKCRSAFLGSKFKQVWIYVVGTGVDQDQRIAKKPKDWTKTKVRPPKSIDVDVGRNSAAMLSEWKAGTRTLESICLETGDDVEEVIDQRAKEAALIKQAAEKYGVEPSQVSDMIAPPPPKGTPAPAEKDDDEEELAKKKKAKSK